MTRESQIHEHYCPQCGKMKAHDPNAASTRIVRSHCDPQQPRICTDCVRVFLANALPVVLSLGRLSHG